MRFDKTMTYLIETRDIEIELDITSIWEMQRSQQIKGGKKVGDNLKLREKKKRDKSW